MVLARTALTAAAAAAAERAVVGRHMQDAGKWVVTADRCRGGGVAAEPWMVEARGWLREEGTGVVKNGRPLRVRRRRGEGGDDFKVVREEKGGWVLAPLQGSVFSHEFR
jgi:hypothetical protein